MSGAAHVSTRFRALDGWRGVCALLVAAHHIEAHSFLYRQPLIRNAWLFVDFFFVLSGFVIAHAYGEALATAPQVRTFALRRLGRLWPLHVAVLAALVGLEFAHLVIAYWHPIAGERAAFTADRSPIAILTNLFLVQSLGLHPYETWNGPAWSISTEFYTYLVFALVYLAARDRALRTALSLLLAVGGVAVLAHFSRYGMRETYGLGFFRCLYGFFAGVLTYEVWRRGVMKRLSGSFAEAIILAAVVAFIALAPGNRAVEYLATPLFALAVLVFAAERGILSRALTTRPAAALGRWSYSIYMVHTLVIVLAFNATHVAELVFHRARLVHLEDGNAIFGLGAWNNLAILAILAAVVALSALTWRVIERPGQRLFNRFAAP
ncbi:MAG TPA: acyltransferase [Rhizomicrobium sp.]|nr:acyltransferase [Rhizomicrobium sp.]